jgi:ethanolaminephosphotransferase
MDLTIRLSRHVARSISSYDQLDAKAKSAEFESTDMNRFVGTLAVLPLGATAFVFKLVFTAKDAPELTRGVAEGLLRAVEDLNLVSLARMVFGGVGLSAVWLVVAERYRSSGKRLRRGNGGMTSSSLLLVSICCSLNIC